VQRVACSPPFPATSSAFWKHGSGRPDTTSGAYSLSSSPELHRPILAPRLRLATSASTALRTEVVACRSATGKLRRYASTLSRTISRVHACQCVIRNFAHYVTVSASNFIGPDYRMTWRGYKRKWHWPEFLSQYLPVGTHENHGKSQDSMKVNWRLRPV
jgi:hypothetical protein